MRKFIGYFRLAEACQRPGCPVCRCVNDDSHATGLAMRQIKGEQVLMRIFIGQTDRWERKPLYSALLELFRSKGLAGATVIQGVAGFGPDSIVHEFHLLRLSQDLPVVIEVVDSEEHIDSVLGEVDRMMSGGLITMEKVRVIYYDRGAKP